MPEGHTLHRYARAHRRDLVGRVLRVTSPQGRFADGAARLDGRRLKDVEAVGKHLFYRWEGGPILHVHLGLFGKFKTFHGEPPPPTEGTRLAMADGDVTLYLAGPTDCSLIDPDEEDAIRARLGPDPLTAGAAGATTFAANLGRRTIPIGAALLDQKVVAGIGNVYRAEVLFLTGIDPATPARDLEEEESAALYRILLTELRRGARAGRIVTVDPAEVGAASRRALRRDERLYVYKRDGLPCRRCGTEILRREMANRLIWACPRCQAA
jgi:formamidopyrimidine-DNA glycosylase